MTDKPKRAQRQPMSKRAGCVGLLVICAGFTLVSFLLQRAGIVPNAATMTVRAAIASDVTSAPRNSPAPTSTDEPAPTDAPTATPDLMTLAAQSLETSEANAAPLREAYAQIDGITRVERGAARVTSSGDIAIEVFLEGSQDVLPTLLSEAQRLYPNVVSITAEIRGDDRWISYQWDSASQQWEAIDIETGEEFVP